MVEMANTTTCSHAMCYQEVAKQKQDIPHLLKVLFSGCPGLAFPDMLTTAATILGEGAAVVKHVRKGRARTWAAHSRISSRATPSTVATAAPNLGVQCPSLVPVQNCKQSRSDTSWQPSS